ncbi:MAG: metallophosphoesterase family protein, partial [Anaerolineales bacterium]|nr:metallophosphoesterase family protein [Anaerolineales bacterium]
MSRITLGLVADTHVPDRRRRLHPGLLPALRAAKVSQILHAGDICLPAILAELGQVAPVLAVRGNRDWFRSADLPLARHLPAGGLRIGLTHGHGGWRAYLGDKLRYLLMGPQSFDFFAQRAAAMLPEADVVVFGHNHEPMVQQVGGRLVVNPGSACCQVFPDRAPTFGLLHINGKQAEAEIVEL